MARRRYKSKRRRRRSYSMRRRKRRPRRIPVLLGKSHVCAHKYADATQLLVDTVAGISVVKTYRANAISQPQPAVPDQPSGFAQMSALFNKHTVIGSKITLTCLPSQNQHARAFYIATELVNRQGQASFDLDQILAQRFVRYAVYSPGDGGGWKPRITSKLSPKKYLGLKDLKDNDQVSALGEGLPEQRVFWNVAMGPTHGTPLQTCDVIIQISYSVLWSDPITPAFT